MKYLIHNFIYSHFISNCVYHMLGDVIDMKRRKLLLGLITMSMVSIVWGAEGLIKETPLIKGDLTF